MEAVTVLPYSRSLTRADLVSVPDDGHRYELIDGTLIVSPAPSTRHQAMSMNLGYLLKTHLPPDLRLLAAPFAVALADDTEVQPDLLVAPRSAFAERDLPSAPLLAVEILSPSTRLIDLNLKKARFEQAGCQSYWVLDPVNPSLVAWELVDGAYVEVAAIAGVETWTAALPFTVTITPADLVD